MNVITELENILKILEQRAKLKELNIKRSELDRQIALFVPSKERLERGRKTLELGAEYSEILELRSARKKNIEKQNSLRDDMAQARTNLQSAGESLTVIESEYRDKLSEQAKLNNLAKKVKTVDEQLKDRQESAVKVREEFTEADKKLRDCTVIIEKNLTEIERLEINLREARKFLQVRTSDEKLLTSLEGIKKCYELYSDAVNRSIELKKNYDLAIKNKTQSQSMLNDRAAMLSEITQKFTIAEKNYTRARSFYESSLKGRSLTEWREICNKNIKRLEDLDELYKKFQDEHALQEKLKNFHEIKTRIQQETRNLNLQDVEQIGKIYELQSESEKLERRVALLRRIEDLDAVRELLQDGIACPLCGSLSHPYVSGASVPNPEQVHEQLNITQKNLENLKAEINLRQERAGKLSEEIIETGREESRIQEKITNLNAEISLKVSDLGLQLGSGISPFEEIDRARQKTRDNLQLARNNADTAENAEREMKNAADELEKIREGRDELTRWHQEALFILQNSRAEEIRLESENKTQNEITASLRRELISQIMPYGYKTLPDKNPIEIIENLEIRKNDWETGIIKRDELERKLTVANTEINNLKKEKDLFKVKREELLSRLKAVEAERDGFQQQRIVLFGSRDPDIETEKMNKEIENLRVQSDSRRENKINCTQKLDEIMTALHSVETDLSIGREMLQKNEINFSKKLLSLGFKSEDDYISSCLNDDERRILQNRLKELTQEDLNLNSEIENVRAKLIELDGNFTIDEFITKINEIEEQAKTEFENNNDVEGLRVYEDLKNKIRDLSLTCGFRDPFTR